MSKFIRHGDVNFHPVSKIKGKLINHNGSFIVARGEATGSTHVLTVQKPSDLVIKQDENGRMYFDLLSSGVITHTHDHEPLTLPAGKYIQIQEREMDHFADSVVRQVLD